jgi:glyoxylase-like metal-dependent hydrolase (beta-lactamase superfamily II)
LTWSAVARSHYQEDYFEKRRLLYYNEISGNQHHKVLRSETPAKFSPAKSGRTDLIYSLFVVYLSRWSNDTTGQNIRRKDRMDVHSQSVREKTVYPLDLNFLGIPGAIASYLIPHAHGAILVESGPGSTISGLRTGLQSYGFTPADVTDVLLTHIHLDHAGAAGWLAAQGARIYVHPLGAPHMLDPEKLLASAKRIYGDQMDTLWGEFLPVPPEQLTVINDDDVVEIGSLLFRAIETPGHASHHYAYLYEDICFSGDIGGVRLHGLPHLRLPMPPPEFNLELWRSSVKRLRFESFQRIAPTHFGIFTDAEWHLEALAKRLDEVEGWIETLMPSDPPVEEINARFLEWTRRRSLAEGLDSKDIETYEAANPSWMSGYGIQRYWKKVRTVAR